MRLGMKVEYDVFNVDSDLGNTIDRNLLYRVVGSV